jgi:hypothetical protein
MIFLRALPPETAEDAAQSGVFFHFAAKMLASRFAGLG